MKRFLIITLCISGIMKTHALLISEIMYDPQGADTGREWVEIYNDTSGAVDPTSWKLFESGINHGIVSYSGGASILPGGYAVVADNPVKFLADYSSYQGVLYDSSFSLSNTGEQIILKDGSLSSVDTITYNTSLGGNDDGTSLSLIASAWTRGLATPGAENQMASASVSVSTSTIATTTNQSTIVQATPPAPDIVLYMPFEKTVVAGAESEFTTYGMTRAGKNIDGLICTWAFGDGGQATGTSTKYRYAYAGRYVAQVEGTNGAVLGTGRMLVHVVSPDISVTNISSGKYGAYIDITNAHAYDLDMSQWRLSINGALFPFPKNTLLPGGGITHFSGAAMGFASTTISSSTVVKILFPNFEEVTSYISPEESKVLGTSTTAQLVRSVPVSKNSYTVPVLKRPMPTSTLPYTATSSKPIFVRKDTRIVSFLKSMFFK